MTIAPYIALFAIVAIGVVEALAFKLMKGDVKLPSRRVQPE